MFATTRFTAVISSNSCKRSIFSRLAYNSFFSNASTEIFLNRLMEYLEKLIEKLRELAQKLIDTLFGPEAETEPELIPIPVNERNRR